LIAFGADVTDGAGAPVNAEHHEWNVEIEHCPTEDSCHRHPQGVFGGVTGGSIPFPDHEAPYEVTFDLTVVSNGSAATASAVAKPKLANLRLNSQPAGIRLVATEQAEAAPFDHQAVVGSLVTLSAPLTHTIGGVEYEFVAWSDGGTASHSITMPASQAQLGLTATYRERVVLVGYRLLDVAGRVYEFGTMPDLGDAPPSTSPAVDIAATESGRGYIVLREDGTVSVHGDAPVDDQIRIQGLPSNTKFVDVELAPGKNGFWLFTADGRVFDYGGATRHGDLTHLVLDKPIIAAYASADGNGYYLVGLDGGVFTFGSALFFGSVPQVLAGVQLDCDVVGLVVASPTGYWLIACDGGVFAFGTAPFVGSLPGIGVVPVSPINGMVGYGSGYLLSAGDGGAFNFGGPFFGSLGETAIPDLIVAVAG